MKKVFIPSLLLLSLVSLTACGDSGLVKGGKAYRDGDAVGISAEVKTAKEGKIKTVTEKLSSKMKVKESAQGVSYSMNQNTESKTVLDLEANTLDYSSKVTMSTGDTKISQESAFKVKEENGEYTLVSGKLDGSITMEAVEFLFLELQTSVYSWNYSGAEGSLLSALAVLGADADESEEAVKFYQNITSKLVIAGSAEAGNLEIGLAEPAKFTVAEGETEIPLEISKFKYTFKDGLLQSNICEAKVNMKDATGAAMNLAYSSIQTFSYVMK